jgi:hypothetical protein
VRLYLSVTENPGHGLINYIDTKAKCCHLKNWPVKGLCGWRYSRSFWYFRSSFENCCPSNLLSKFNPPPSSLCQSTVCTDSVWLDGGWGCWVLLEAIFCRSLTLCIWPDSEPTKLLDHYKNLRGEVVLQINTWRKVPLQVNFFTCRHFALASI